MRMAYRGFLCQSLRYGLILYRMGRIEGQGGINLAGSSVAELAPFMHSVSDPVSAVSITGKPDFSVFQNPVMGGKLGFCIISE